jgi:hypothetical protein
MNDSLKIETARNTTLQKIGRNVVNLAKMEAMLKELLRFCDFTSTAEFLSKNAAARIKKVARMPMGALVDEAPKSLFFENAREAKETRDMFDPTFSFAFSIEGSKEMVETWHAEMKFVVEERNTLIHRALARFDPNSLESCEALSAQLDEQRARMLRPCQWLESTVLAYREAVKEVSAAALAKFDSLAGN